MSLTLLFGAACAVLGPAVVLLAIALLSQLWSQSLRLTEMSRALDVLVQQLSASERQSKDPSPTSLDATIDSSPKAGELDIFAAKVSFTSWELRDLIEATAIACPPSTRDDILSKAEHALGLVSRYRLDRGLGTTRSEKRLEDKAELTTPQV